MDATALKLVKSYVEDKLDKSKQLPDYECYIVWKCKVLQNWKYLISTTLPDGMYYEVTFNGDKAECYLDAYRRVDNITTHYEERLIRF